MVTSHLFLETHVKASSILSKKTSYLALNLRLASIEAINPFIQATLDNLNNASGSTP